MRFGCCIPSQHAIWAARLGYDYVEIPVAELYPDGTDAEFGVTSRSIEAGGIPALAFNNVGYPTSPVVGPDVDPQGLARYAEVASRRAATLGGKLIILESASSRRVPVGFPMARAVEQYREFLRMAGDTAGRHGLTVGLEPVNRTETNLVHTIAEAAQHVAAVDHPAVGIVADAYHMHMEGEPLRDIMLAAGHLAHLQASDTGRSFPGSHSFDLWSLFIYLNHMGWDEQVSVECRWESFQHEGAYALVFLRQAAEQRGEIGFTL